MPENLPNAQMRLFGGAQYHRAMAEFRNGIGQLTCPDISREEIVNACGIDDFHDGVNYTRTACVIAVSKARDVFEPFLHQVCTTAHACANLSTSCKSKLCQDCPRHSCFQGQRYVEALPASGMITSAGVWRKSCLVRSAVHCFEQRKVPVGSQSVQSHASPRVVHQCLDMRLTALGLCSWCATLPRFCSRCCMSTQHCLQHRSTVPFENTALLHVLNL